MKLDAYNVDNQVLTDGHHFGHLHQGSKLLGFWMSGIPKNGDRNPILGSGFPTGNLRIVRLTDRFFSERKLRNCRGNPKTEAGFPNGNPDFNRNF